VSSKSLPNIIGIIPARYGSTRFPGKPLALISGKTLIQRTFESAKRFHGFQQIIVATDDQRIADHVRGFGGKAIMTSPSCPTGTDRLAEVVRNHPEFAKADFVFNVQGDEPCVNPELISQICKAIVDDPSVPMATAAIPLLSKEEALRPSVVKCVLDLNQNALYFSRALIPVSLTGHFDPKITYYRHVGTYCYTTDFLLRYAELPSTPLQEIEQLEQLKVLEHGYRIKVAIVSETTLSPAVDLPEDIKKVEQVLCNQNTSSSQAALSHP
jgi:3-deoxy-manno-octulosonate cytidylyltransferase (CMP-KDO synthetase)